jgi:LysM repeat protein
MTVVELLNANPKLLKLGEQLTIINHNNIPNDNGGDTTPDPEPQIKHTVKSGETLFAISTKYGTTVAKIVEANDIVNPNLIDIGQVLIIPTK